MIQMTVSSCVLQDDVMNCSFILHFVPHIQGYSVSNGTSIVRQDSVYLTYCVAHVEKKWNACGGFMAKPERKRPL
jgi:hypothetical protein